MVFIKLSIFIKFCVFLCILVSFYDRSLSPLSLTFFYPTNRQGRGVAFPWTISRLALVYVFIAATAIGKTIGVWIYINFS